MLVDVRFVCSRCFSAPQSRSASLPRRLLSCCSGGPLPPPRRAQQAVRSGLLCCGIIGSRPLTPWPSVVAGAQDEGKGGEARAAPSSRSPAASWATPDARSPPLAARSRPVEPAAARRNCLFAPLHDSLCGCCCLQGKGRRRRERAGSSCTRLRHEKDDDKEDKKKMETVLISTI